MAAECGQEVMAEVLLAAGARVDVVTNHGHGLKTFFVNSFLDILLDLGKPLSKNVMLSYVSWCVF